MNSSDYNPELLKQARKGKFTQKELADLLEVTEMTIYRAEKGTAASYELLSRMCQQIGVDVKKILISSTEKNFLPVA